MPSISETTAAVRQGATGNSLSGAIANIDGWTETLSGLDAPGAQDIVNDLAALKAQLQSSTIDAAAIGALVARLGEQTMALAGSAGGSSATDLEELGQALVDSADAQGAPTA